MLQAGVRLAVSIGFKDLAINQLPGLAARGIGAVRGEAEFQFSSEFIRNGKKLGIVENRVPDFADQLESLGDRQLADFGDVLHAAIVPPAANLPFSGFVPHARSMAQRPSKLRHEVRCNRELDVMCQDVVP